MWKALVTIPLQLVCQLAIQGDNGTENAPFVAGTKLSEATTVTPDFALRSANRTTELPEGYTAFPDIGAAYKYYPESVTWNMARKNCIANDSILAEIDSFEKIKYALSMKDESNSLAVGIHRVFDDTEWTSLKTGLQVTMIPWAADSNNGVTDRQCMVMYFDGRGLTAGYCNDETYHYVCEIPLPID